MRNTGFGLSALLIAAGAVLAWAVTYEAEGIDLNQVGIILFVVGLGLAGLTLLTSVVGSKTTVESQSEGVVDGQPVVERRSEVVSER